METVVLFTQHKKHCRQQIALKNSISYAKNMKVSNSIIFMVVSVGHTNGITGAPVLK